ncbi:hypothetical protein HW130_32240 [Streptomyces sp. PKU-EA00015]|uniref:hypothetical protein n=1 Tax=Streptomyces sp. PKU-EA00015 TaxID=2748326 RepID=UPI0015A1EC6B|nr:hypothetical protein [Streptomyces sp. PKU-EA00015]NWF30863.1 hypothetical protein [Streptomyces sp. PKU-EA00015]
MTTPADNAPGTDTQSPILATAQELLATRMNVIPPLADAIAERKRLQELINANEKTYGAAYSDAQAAGWTPEELRQMGAEEPTRRPQGRPKGARTKRPRAAAPTAPGPRTPDATESAVPTAASNGS